MQHPNFETRHPLQTEEQQETGFDPLHNFNKNRSRGSLESSSISQCQSTFHSYRKEWDDLFLNSNYLARIRQAGISGRLRSSRFRSVCWKLYLEVLPENKGQWNSRTKELRAQYEKIKETHITNPRKAAGQQDLVVNNPLSQDEGSLWNKFFQDKELKGMIKQDVFRTFPEIRYFQDEDVRTKLTDILFCYARENEQLLYKQGMHELLAPIVFVLHCDHQAFQHASETSSPSEEMKCLLNPAYLEHDAYAMFSHLMDTAEPWFSSFEREVRKGKEEMLTSIPFARPQDSGPSVAIVTKVNRIQDQLVKKHDVELHMHLNRLEIAPQIYGIRWVRLLFGREFPLQDLLVVWDALFADSITLDLVDYIFVAMLLYIRDALIASNFQTCLGLLMHYPPIGDINALLQKALFLRDPKNNPRPVNYQFQQNLDYYKTRGADLMNKSRGSDVSSSSPPLSATKKESFFTITRSRSHSKSMGRRETEEDLEAQVSFLQGQINDLEAMSKYCAKMMNTHIFKIQEVILQENLDKEDEVLVSLAGLKQIKDILKGALRFNQSQLEAEENEEITIADDHYTSSASAAKSTLSSVNHYSKKQAGGAGRPSRDSDLDGSMSTDEREEELAATPPNQQVVSSLGSEGKNWDDYILVSQDEDLLADARDTGSVSDRLFPIRRGPGVVRLEPEGASGTFHDPLLMAGTTSGSSSPEEGSTHSKDSDFTIVNPNDL
uniref:TBC1 domain family member 5 n=1 Tax=Nothobranchius rachovii TaxID=451742 RepID=A0A1A8QL02_9TELE